MCRITVKVYERIKVGSRWCTVPVELRRMRKKDGKLFLGDDRVGRFRISWYENRKKQWQSVVSRVSHIGWMILFLTLKLLLAPTTLR